MSKGSLIKPVGQANHLFDPQNGKRELTFIRIESFETDSGSHVLLRHEYNDESLIVFSLAQWEQMDAIVRRAFRDME